MSVAVCRGPAVPAFVEAPSWMRPAELYKPEPLADDRPAQVDIWNAIQADVAVDNNNNNKASDPGAQKASSKPYVRRSSSSSRLMSQRSLEICTESLGCETGSGDFTDMSCLFAPPPPTAAVAAEESFWQQQPSAAAQENNYSDESFRAVKYHRPSGTTRSSRSFPPPLPSMSSRDGPCLKMCPRRQDGRLVVEAVAVRPRGYLEASRQGGRLRLSFIECASARAGQSGKISTAIEASYFPVVEEKQEEEEEVAVDVEAEEEEDEEEVEVVDRGTMVEVKVSSSQPQTAAAAKVHRSTLVINKFVGSTPFDQQPRFCHADNPELCARDDTTQQASPPSTLRRVPSSTTTLAAAVAVASTETGAPPAPGDEDDDEDGEDERAPSAVAAADSTKQQLLLFTSRRGDKHDLLQSVRRCRQLRQKPLFILEPYCIATS